MDLPGSWCQVVLSPPTARTQQTYFRLCLRSQDALPYKAEIAVQLWVTPATASPVSHPLGLMALSRDSIQVDGSQLGNVHTVTGDRTTCST